MSKKSKKKSRVKLSRRTMITIVIVVIVLVAAVGAGVLAQFLQKQAQTNQSNEGASDFTISGGPPLPKTVVDSQNLAAQGKIDEANKKIDEAFAKDPGDDTKYELYIQQALNDMNQSKFSDAVVKLKKAEAIKADFKVTRLIAQAAEAAGDKALAIEYYKKAIPLIDPENPIKDSEKRRLEDKIRELGGQV